MTRGGEIMKARPVVLARARSGALRPDLLDRAPLVGLPVSRRSLNKGPRLAALPVLTCPGDRA